MKIDTHKNIENGLAEIRRREILYMASIGLILPYGLIVIWPVSVNLGKFMTIPFLFLYAFFLFRVNKWLHRTPCPRCGKAIGNFNRIRAAQCASCKLEIKAPGWFGDKLSFKPIQYIPGMKWKNN